MKYNRGFSPILIIVLVFLVVIGFVYFKYNSQTTENEVENSLNNNQVVQNEENECGVNSIPSITVLSPNGGEVYQEGQNITVTWKSCNLAVSTPVTVLLQANFGEGQWNTSPLATFDLTSRLVAGNLSNSGQATFTLPTQDTKSWTGSSETMKYGNSFRVYVSQNLEDNIDASDMSDNNFTINKNNSFVISTDLSKYDIGVQAGWPPIIKNLNTAYSCTPIAQQSEVSSVEQKIINGKTYCVSTTIEGAAGSRYGEYTYTRKNGNGIKTTNFILRWSSCDNFESPKHEQCKINQNIFFSNMDTLIDSLMK